VDFVPLAALMLVKMVAAIDGGITANPWDFYAVSVFVVAMWALRRIAPEVKYIGDWDRREAHEVYCRHSRSQR
jgi:hypothetical protein